MWFVIVLMTLMLLADVWWWYLADRHAQRLPKPIVWRVALAIAMLAAMYGLGALLFARFVPVNGMVLTEQQVVLTYIWHLLILPLIALPSFAWRIGVATTRLLRRPKPVPEPVDAVAEALSRRAFLSGVIVSAPPVLALGMGARAAMTRDEIIVKKLDLPLATLPPRLDGLRIAHVSDPHVYSFLSNDKFEQIVKLTNDLDADLVLHTGDLINHQMKDLPDGIQLLQQVKGRHGTFSCNGNHDTFVEGGELFERDTVRAGLNMLLDESRVIEIEGHKVQILAPRWPGHGEQAVQASVHRLSPQRRSDAFQILLAHHPHSFDAASDVGIPLTLSGHTHGGQLGLSPQWSFGALMYRYWTGLYRRSSSALVVSNGIGNWFPLRINVPCEIIEITLRRA